MTQPRFKAGLLPAMGNGHDRNNRASGDGPAWTPGAALFTVSFMFGALWAMRD